MSASLRRKLQIGEAPPTESPSSGNSQKANHERLDAIRSLNDSIKSLQEKLNIIEYSVKNCADLNSLNEHKSKTAQDIDTIALHIEVLENSLKKSIDDKINELKDELYLVIEDNIVSATPRLQGNIGAINTELNNKIELLEIRLKQLETSTAKRSFSRGPREALETETVEPKKLVVNKIKIGPQ